MNFPRYKAGPVDAWVADAGTQFVNGFIKGWKHAIGTGAGTGILTGTTEVSQNMTAIQQILISAGATTFSMLMSGMNEISSWHETHPFPNPFPPPTGTTTPPFTPPPP